MTYQKRLGQCQLTMIFFSFLFFGWFVFNGRSKKKNGLMRVYNKAIRQKKHAFCNKNDY